MVTRAVLFCEVSPFARVAQSYHTTGSLLGSGPSVSENDVPATGRDTCPQAESIHRSFGSAATLLPQACGAMIQVPTWSAKVPIRVEYSSSSKAILSNRDMDREADAVTGPDNLVREARVTPREDSRLYG